MRRLFLSIFSIIILFSCASYRVEVKDNPFTKSKDIVLKMWHKVESGNLDNLEAIYLCEIKDNKRAPTKVNFHFQLGAIAGRMANPLARYKDVDIDPMAYILVDNNSYVLKVSDIQTDKMLTLYGNRGSMYGGTYNEMYCSVTLTPEIEKAIPNASHVMYRFSAGGDPTTLQVKPDQLEKMKEFFSIR